MATKQLKKGNFSADSSAKVIKERPQSKHLKPFPKGVSGNPAGKPVGTRSYMTIYRAALENLAKKKEITSDQLEELMLQVGVSKAMGGDYRFYQDILDRKDGKPTQKNETKLEGILQVQQITGMTITKEK